MTSSSIAPHDVYACRPGSCLISARPRRRGARIGVRRIHRELGAGVLVSLGGDIATAGTVRTAGGWCACRIYLTHQLARGGRRTT